MQTGSNYVGEKIILAVCDGFRRRHLSSSEGCDSAVWHHIGLVWRQQPHAPSRSLARASPCCPRALVAVQRSVVSSVIDGWTSAGHPLTNRRSYCAALLPMHLKRLSGGLHFTVVRSAHLWISLTAKCCSALHTTDWEYSFLRLEVLSRRNYRLFIADSRDVMNRIVSFFYNNTFHFHTQYRSNSSSLF